VTGFAVTIKLRIRVLGIIRVFVRGVNASSVLPASL